MVRTFVIDKPAFATVRGRMAVTLAGVSGFVIISVRRANIAAAALPETL